MGAVMSFQMRTFRVSFEATCKNIAQIFVDKLQCKTAQMAIDNTLNCIERKDAAMTIV